MRGFNPLKPRGFGLNLRCIIVDELKLFLGVGIKVKQSKYEIYKRFRVHIVESSIYICLVGLIWTVWNFIGPKWKEIN